MRGLREHQFEPSPQAWSVRGGDPCCPPSSFHLPRSKPSSTACGSRSPGRSAATWKWSRAISMPWPTSFARVRGLRRRCAPRCGRTCWRRWAPGWLRCPQSAGASRSAWTIPPATNPGAAGASSSSTGTGLHGPHGRSRPAGPALRLRPAGRHVPDQRGRGRVHRRLAGVHAGPDGPAPHLAAAPGPAAGLS
jgi:hypothetical protein